MFLVSIYLLVLSFLTKIKGNQQINNYGCSYMVKLEPTPEIRINHSISNPSKIK